MHWMVYTDLNPVVVLDEIVALTMVVDEHSD